MVRLLPIQQNYNIMDKKEILFELDKWVSDKGNGGFIETNYDPYYAVHHNNLNEELGIQQNREELNILASQGPPAWTFCIGFDAVPSRPVRGPCVHVGALFQLHALGEAGRA